MKPLRLLSIGAHPADIFDQSGGVMAHHVARGDYVGCVVLTHGARIHDMVISDAMQRGAEVPESDELLALMGERADVRPRRCAAPARFWASRICISLAPTMPSCWSRPDRAPAGAALRELRPDIVLTHFPREGDGLANPHAVAGQIMLHAIQLAASVDPGDRHSPHRVAQTFFSGAGAASLPNTVRDAARPFYNDVFIDITDVVDKSWRRWTAWRARATAGLCAQTHRDQRWRVWHGGGLRAYAEGFISAKAETHYYLPLTEHALLTARSSDHENMGRYSYRVAVD